MTLLEALTLEIESDLAGMTSRTEVMGTLSSDLSASGATTVTVDEKDVMTRGLVQVGSELMMVTSFAGQEGQVPAWGRGYAGSAAAAHAAGTQLVVAPLFPRHRVERAILETVADLYPDVFGVGKYSFTVSAAQSTYELPAKTQGVLRVSSDTVGPSRRWVDVKSWRFHENANLAEFPTGKALTLGGNSFRSGAVVDVLVETKPSISSTTESWGDAFLLDTTAEPVRWGAKYRLVSNVDFANIDAMSVSAGLAQRSETRTSATDLSRQLFALYRDAVDRERGRLLSTVPKMMYRVG